MKLHTIHKVYQDAETQELGQMSQEEYDKMIKQEITNSIAKVIFEKGNIPIIKSDSGELRKGDLGFIKEPPFFQYESELILLSRSEFEKILGALRTIKDTL